MDAGRTTSAWPSPRHVARVGIVARFKPVHLGHAAVLRALVRCADTVVVGIGSANRYDMRNPFTAEESEQMIRSALSDVRTLRFLHVPDLGDGPRWRRMVKDLMGPMDLFATANAYVRDLMAEWYTVVHPATLVPPGERLRLDGSMVRRAMARGDNWRELVPVEVAGVLDRRGITARFRREFGLETLAQDAPRPVD